MTTPTLAAGVGGLGVLAVVAALDGRRAPRRSAIAVADATADAAASQLRRRSVIAVVGVLAVVALAADPALGVLALAGLLGWAARRRVQGARQERRLQATAAAQLPDAIDLLITCLQAGQTPPIALVELAARAPPAVRPAFVAASGRLHRGDGFADAVTELVGHCGPPAVPVVAMLAAASRDGLPLLPMLDRLATEAEARRRRLAEAEARKLPVRLAFPLVGCTLPSFVLLAIVPAILGALSGLQLPT